MKNVSSSAEFEKNELQVALDFLWPRLALLEPRFSPEEEHLLCGLLGNEIDRVNYERQQAAEPPMSKEEMIYFFQYAPRAAQKAGLENYTPVWVDPLAGTLPGEWDEQKWEDVLAVGDYLFPNLRKEIQAVVEQYGTEMREILDRDENLVFVCTHPSWFTLAFPIEMLRQVDPKEWTDHIVSLVLAPGPMMFRKKIGPVTFDPGPMLRASGTNVLLTTPLNHGNETNADVKNMGDRSRDKFKIQFAREMAKMRSQGGRSLVLAPEGTTTPTDEVTGEYKLEKITDGTAGMLHRLAELGNTHFVLTGMGEEKIGRRDTDPTDISIDLQILPPEVLTEILKESVAAVESAWKGGSEKEKEAMIVRDFGEVVMHRLAEIVDGTYVNPESHMDRVVTTFAERFAATLD